MEKLLDRSEIVVRCLTESQTALRLYVRALVPNLADAQDVLQETNLDIWRKAATYDPSRPFLPWAKTLAHFQVLKYRQTNQRAKLVFDDALFAEISERLAADDSLANDSTARLAALEACLAELPGRSRAFLSARYGDEKTLAAAAAEFHTSVEAAWALLTRVRRLLMRCVARRLAATEALS